METLFANGRIVDAILVLVAVEAAVIFFYRRLTQRGPSLLTLLPNLLSGVFLLLALRAALVAASWWVIALMLTGALIAHVLDLLRAKNSLG